VALPLLGASPGRGKRSLGTESSQRQSVPRHLSRPTSQDSALQGNLLGVCRVDV
jgi:hypothetical protein